MYACTWHAAIIAPNDRRLARIVNFLLMIKIKFALDLNHFLHLRSSLPVVSRFTPGWSFLAGEAGESRSIGDEGDKEIDGRQYGSPNSGSICVLNLKIDKIK